MVKSKFAVHIRENLISYIIIFIVFCGGIFMGSINASKMGKDEFNGVYEYLNGLKAFFDGNQLKTKALVINTLSTSLKEIAVIWIMGFMVVGFVPVMYIVFSKGFIIGTCTAVFLRTFAVQGLYLSAGVFALQCLIYIPVMFWLAFYGISLSSGIIRKIFAKNYYYEDYKKVFSSYIINLFIAVAITIVYVFAESSVAPALIKYILR